MTEFLELVGERGVWLAVVALGLPTALVVLTELAFALTRRGHPVTPWVRQARNWLVPLLFIVVFVRGVLALPADSLTARLATTLAWVGLVIVAGGAASALVFDGAPPQSWQQRVPRLLRDLVRVLMVAIAAAIAFSWIWDREIGGALAALGVTSIVVGLALQEPLGNLFSGLMLLMERPFEVGDSIEVGGISGTVREINWRSAHIEAFGGMTQVVPNSTLNKEIISNYSRPRPIRMELLELAFSYDDPPNTVRRTLLDVARTTPGVLQDPKPIAATVGYGERVVNYRLIWRVAEDDRWSVRNDLVTRIWYAARRKRLSLANPLNVNVQRLAERGPRLVGLTATDEAPRSSLFDRLPNLPRIPGLDRTAGTVLAFGKGEVIFDEGQRLEGAYILVSGGVSLQLVREGQIAEITKVIAGEFFGEAGMIGSHAADVRAVATEDSEVVLIDPDSVRLLFEASPTLARETGQVLDVRRKALQSARVALRRH